MEEWITVNYSYFILSNKINCYLTESQELTVINDHKALLNGLTKPSYNKWSISNLLQLSIHTIRYTTSQRKRLGVVNDNQMLY